MLEAARTGSRARPRADGADISNADRRPSRSARRLHFLGTPEGELALAEAAVYLACAPKSNAVYTAFDQARADVHARPAEPVPLHLRNAPTRLMTGLGYGAGYRYAHDDPDAVVLQEHLPAALHGRTYYHPVPRGFEQEIRARLERWRAELRRRKAEEAP
jgi:putative ATPase